MANRYWVGGTNTWDSDPGTKWSDTSGGVGGASVPTINDDVFFNSASVGTVTIGVNYSATAKNLTFFSGFNNTVNSYSSSQLLISGDLTLTSTLSSFIVKTVFIGSGTFISAGENLSSATFVSSGSSANVTQGDALRAGGLIVAEGGVFDTASYTTQFSNITGISGTINLGSSTFTVDGGSGIKLESGFVLNAGTSNAFLNTVYITCPGGATFYNVTRSGFISPKNSLTQTNTVFTGPLSFNNLTILPPNNNGLHHCCFSNDITVTGTFTVSGQSEFVRNYVRAGTEGINGLGFVGEAGSGITITASSLVADHCDFRNVTIAGNASGASPSGAGDCGGNTGIVFPTPKTVYRVGTDTTWKGNSSWATTSSGVGSDSNFPLAQDTAIIDEATALGGTLALSNAYNFPSVDCSTRTSAISINHDRGVSRYGSYILGPGVNVLGGTQQDFAGTGTSTFATLGKTINFPVSVNTPGTLQLSGTLSGSFSKIYLLAGTFDTQNENITAVNAELLIEKTSTVIPQFILGSSTVTLNRINSTRTGDVNFDAGTSQITLSGSTALLNVLNPSGFTFYNVTFPARSNDGYLGLLGNNTFNNLTLGGLTSTGNNDTVFYVLSGNITVNNTLTCSGTTVRGRTCLRTAGPVYNFTSRSFESFLGPNGFAPGSGVTITASSLVADYCDFKDITIAGGASGTSPSGAGDCGGNTGIVFPTPKTVYRVGSQTNWHDISGWALTSSGASSPDNFPLPQDTAIIDDGTSYTGTLRLGANYNYPTINCSGRTSGLTLDHDSTAYIVGDYFLGPGITAGTNTAIVSFIGTGTRSFVSAGKDVFFRPIVDMAAGDSLSLQDALLLRPSNSQLSLRNGTLNTNGYNVTVSTFSGSSRKPRTLTMGSSLFSISGASVTVWQATGEGLTVTPNTANILLTNTGNVSNRRFYGGDGTYNKLTIGSGAGSGITLRILPQSVIGEFASEKTNAYEVLIHNPNDDTPLTIDKWSISGSSGNLVTVRSETNNTRTFFNLTNPTEPGIDYLIVRDVEVGTEDKFYVGANSTDSGNNINVYFTDPPAAGNSNLFLLYQ
jgi:hypothetical protein